MNFVWDESKNKANIKKHGIDFEEASTVFLDPNALVIPDIEHSENEDRFIILGLSSKTKLLVVVHCYKEVNSEIRIISSRKATKNEARQYGGK